MVAFDSLAALPLRGPVLTASGALGYDAGRMDPTATEHLGAVVTRGVAGRSRSGSAPHLIETPAGVVYRPGRARLGAGAAARRFEQAWVSAAVPVIVNLDVEAAGEFVAGAAELEGVRGVAALELNLAAQNAATGAPFGHDAIGTGQIIRAVRQACGLPVLAKLPADAPQPPRLLEVCAAAEAAGVVLACGMPLTGGVLVGPATFPVILALVRRLAPGSPLPLIACGGVATVGQAADYLRAGAVAVQIGSALLANPHAAADVARSLAQRGWT